MQTKKSSRTVVAHESQEYEPLDSHPAADTVLCPDCGELLAWHEQPCATLRTAASEGVAAETLAVFAEPVIQLASSVTFTYEVGRPVQPLTSGRAHTVIWRGQLKERHPRTGLVHRINVYRLDDGYWDCYREEELQAA